jgi:hypothetical protein
MRIRNTEWEDYQFFYFGKILCFIFSFPAQDVMPKLHELEQLILNSPSAAAANSGRAVTSDEYNDISSLLRHLEEENGKKFCEFGGLVESLQVCMLCCELLAILEEESSSKFQVLRYRQFKGIFLKL